MSARTATPYDRDAAAVAAASQQYLDMQLDPFDFDAPRGAQGIGESFKGLMVPSAEAGRSVLMAGAPVAQGLDWIANLNPEREERGESPTAWQDAYFQGVEDFGTNAVESWRPDVQAMGTTARALNTVNTVVGSVPQMIGTPGVFLTSAAMTPATDLVREGVDVETAATVGGVNLAVNAIGMKLPAAWGSNLVTRVGTGAGANLATGVAADAASNAVLEAGGYEQADWYNPTDPYARGLDFLMGAAFGVKAHVDAPRLSPTQRDAAMVANNAAHFRQDSMPGTPAEPGAAMRHQMAMATGINQVMAGNAVSVADQILPGDFTLPPHLEAALRATEAPQPAATAPFSSGNYETFRRALESGGRADARNPASSATGIDQFTAATWRRIVARAKPAWAEGLSDADLLAARLDPEKSGQMARALDADNSAVLQAAGLPASDHNLYALHHFGINKGKAFARAADSTPIGLILSKDQIAANPYLQGKTKGDVLANWDERARRAGAAPSEHPVARQQPSTADLPARRPDIPSHADEAAAPRPTVDQLRSGAELFPEPPPRATPAEFDAWTEGRMRAQLPETTARLQEELAGAQDAAQATAARAQAALDDAAMAQEARDAAAHVGALEQRIATAEAGQVELPEPEAQRRAYEDWQAQAATPRQSADAGGESRQRSSHLDGQVREVLQRVDEATDGAELAPGIRARHEGDGYRVTVDPETADALRQAQVSPPEGRLLSRDELAAAVRTAVEELEASPAAAAGRVAEMADPISAARTVAQLDPDLRVPTGEVDADGNPVFQTAEQAMADAQQGIRDAELDAQATHAAANCYLRTGV